MENWNKNCRSEKFNRGPNMDRRKGVTLLRMFRKPYMVMGLQEKN